MTFHHAEAFPDSGGMFGTSAASALGRPNLEAWDLFTRETLQNSWDARDLSRDDDGVTFAIDYVDLTGHRAESLRQFFDGQTLGLPKLNALLQAKGSGIPLLIVSDAGTVGLQGPTSAAVHSGSNSREDFVSFIRNIGRPSSKELRGGTYGFGKGVLFNMGETNTVLVYTRTVDENYQPVHRFIAMANSDGFSDGDSRYTGRHWWGIEQQGKFGNPFAEPLTGLEADALAHTLHMDRHFTDERSTGTSIAVIAPRNPDTSGDHVAGMMDTIAAALTKWAWPHMVETVDGLDPIDFLVSANGIPVPVPDPEKDPLVSKFVKAYRTALQHPEPADPSEFTRNFEGSTRRRWVDVCSKNPQEFVGRLAVTTYSVDRIQQPSILESSLTHHVALMRNPRMVVTYWPGPQNETDENFAGVFVASKHLDPVFAASEPTAHDEWNPKTVDLKDEKLLNPATGRARTTNPVNIALRDLRRFLKPNREPMSEPTDSGYASEVTAIANQLGNIFSGAAGSDARVKPTKSGDSGSRQKPRQKNGVSTSVELHDLAHSNHGAVAIFRVKVISSDQARERGLEVWIQSYPLVDGKKISQFEELVEEPKPLGWIQPHDLVQDWDSFVAARLQASPNGLRMRVKDWEGYFAVLQPQDTAITAEVKTCFESEDD